jgi:hypothetical protein
MPLICSNISLLGLHLSVYENKIERGVFQGCRMYNLQTHIAFYRLPSGLPMINDERIVNTIVLYYNVQKQRLNGLLIGGLQCRKYFSSVDL